MAPSAGFEPASQPCQGRILDRAILQGSIFKKQNASFKVCNFGKTSKRLNYTRQQKRKGSIAQPGSALAF